MTDWNEMTDAEFDDDDDAAIKVGRKIIDGAERLRSMNLVAPGAVARWAFEMDDIRFNVAITVAAKEEVAK